MLRMISIMHFNICLVKHLTRCCCLSLFIISLGAKGQSNVYRLSPKIDSLVNLLTQELPGSEKNKVLEALEALRPMKKITSLKGQLDQAKGNERLEMELNEKLGRESGWLGMSSYQYFTRALFLAEKLQDNRTIAVASLEIGNNIRLGTIADRDFKPYFQRAIDIFEALDDPLSQSYMLYARLLLASDSEQMRVYADEGVALLKENLDTSDTLMMESLAKHLNVAGTSRTGEQKLRLLREGLSVAKASGNNVMQVFILNNIGFDFYLNRQYDSAIYYYRQAMEVSLLNGLKGLALNSLYNLSTVYRARGMDKEALAYFGGYVTLLFDINNDKYFEDMAELEVRHETDRIELQNELLLTEQKLQGRQNLILITISVLLMVVAAFIFWSRRRVAKTNEKLKALDKTKSRFFANISHELRTPLTLINAPLESLVHSGRIDDPEVRQTIETATRNGEGLLSLVEEILDLAKLDGGKLQLVENPVRVNDFMVLILSDYKAGLDHKSIKLSYDYKPEEELAVLIDERRCTKIINNLLSNALKFTPNGGEISVMIDKDDRAGKLRIIVSDTGVGIHPEDLPHIFNRYYQSEQPGKKAEGGTGIGLALAKELAELHGGTLRVRSELGKGSTFTFELPVRQVLEETIVTLSQVEDKALEEAMVNTIEKYAQKFQVNKPVLLVTEDHPEMRAFIAKTLAPYFDIRQAENGKLALEVLNSERVDIVISDVMMPVMDGFELLEEIKKNEALHQVSLIMLTARADHEDKLYALTLGIDDYLTKPFNASEFLARIKNILDNRIKIIREVNKTDDMDSLSDLARQYDLVEREIEILELLAKRYTNPQIAEALFISRNTVKYHIKNLFGKMGIKTRQQAAERVKI